MNLEFQYFSEEQSANKYPVSFQINVHQKSPQYKVYFLSFAAKPDKSIDVL